MPTIGDMPDAVSNVLEHVRMRGEFVCESEAAAPWSTRIERPGSHMHVVLEGSAWLKVDGDSEPRRLSNGDLVLLPHGGAHVLCSDPNLAPIALERAIAADAARDNLVFHMGADGVETRLICARFYFSGLLAQSMIAALPKLIHLTGNALETASCVNASSSLIATELRDPRPGSAITIVRLLDVLFVQALRAWGATASGNGGWLSGLSDEHVGRALAAMHDHPAKDWTVEELATIAAMSRSAFAVRFTNVVGQPPLRYLASWRLDLAAGQLRAGSSRVADIARNVGYGSEAALTRAFKTRFSATPAEFRRAARRAIAARGSTERSPSAENGR